MVAESLCDLGINGFLRPGDETSPVTFGVLPDDFDQVQTGTMSCGTSYGRRGLVEEHCAMRWQKNHRSIVT
jgi:hypothetical protein